MKHVLFFIFIFLAAESYAKSQAQIWSALEELYPSAEKHRALENANDDLDRSKIKSYVVVMQGGIPAERAAFYIGWGDYDYRGVTIDGNEVKTRRGRVYTFLQKGDVMAVAESSHVGRTFYLKLISPDVYIPETRKTEKHHSRVTTMVALKFPKEIMKADDDKSAVQFVEGWLKPFRNFDEALSFGKEL